jgi:Fur family ferric uptake transcriptional regulator
MEKKYAARKGGYVRRTQAREAMKVLVQKTKTPLSAPEIQTLLAKRGIRVNKTTIYRALASFCKAGRVREVLTGEREVRYEWADQPHHHHLVCVGCRRIEDVVLQEDLEREEKKIAAARRFKILNHSLEFFGLCQKCQLYN